MRTISVLNLKGGVGKTLTAVNMAYELWRRGYKVLLLDNDKQGNLSKAYGRYDTQSVAPTTKLLAAEWQKAEDIIQPTDYEGIDIISANMSLFGAAWNLGKDEATNQTDRYKRFFDAACITKPGKVSGTHYYFAPSAEYDYCIIDNPPDIGLNVINALTASDSIIVPVKIDEWALEGLDILAEQIEDAKALNKALEMLGVLVTEYRNTDAEAAGVEWIEKSKYNLLGIIRYSKKVAESTFSFKPIYEYSPCSAAAQDYKRLATQITGKDRKGGRK